MFLIDNSYYKIKNTKGKGRGVFAEKIIKAKTIIGEYAGEKVEIEKYDLEKDKYGLYLMFLNDEYAIYPDLTKIDIYLINHSCEPNCWIMNHDDHVYFFALRDIKVEEELTISYLLPPKDKICNPCNHICKCGGKKCTGSMHQTQRQFERWQAFQKKLC
ncbi:MAG: Nuclear protein SET [uncultured bacterium]|nr:MAG: Nuclear protein SET [uncultured bacterium]